MDRKKRRIMKNNNQRMKRTLMFPPLLTYVFVWGLLAMLQITGCGAAEPGPSDQWLPASAEKLPRWRGFNLINAYMLQYNKPFDEADFRIIRDLGFNFVRL